MSRVVIAPSILSADFARLPDEIARCEAGGADWIHVDVMDGRFVPNLTFGAKVIETVRRLTRLPIDVHLMVVEPERYFDDFAAAGATGMTIHAEVSPHLHRQLSRIRELGCAAGAAINPSTPLDAAREVVADLDLLLCMTVNPGWGGQAFLPASIGKLERLRQLLAPDTTIEVDGGIDTETAPRCAEAGATLFVAGSAIFGQEDPAGAYRELVRAVG